MTQVFRHIAVLLTMLLSLCSLNAWSTVTFNGVTGVSSPADGSGAAWNLYGGFAYITGDTACAAGVCNTCTGVGTALGLNPCSQTSVFPTTTLNFSLTVAAAVAGSSWKVCAGTTEITQATTTTGTQFNYAITWGNLCSALGNTSTCSTTGVVSNFTIGYATAAQACGSLTDVITFKVYVSNHVGTIDELTTDAIATTNTAALAFQTFPGDEKVYLLPDGFTFAPSTAGTVPSAGSTGLLYTNLLFFYKPIPSGDLTGSGINNASPSISIPISQSDSSLNRDFLDGLTNDVRYCFRMATQDNTGVISYFTPDTALAANVCQTPSEVVGLLADKKCFIATAAFGSALDPHVTSFRQFRNQFLLNTTLGKLFVKTYYKYSPPLAQFISENETLKTIVQFCLWPLLWFVEMSLAWGVTVSLCISLIALFVVRFAMRKLLRFA